MLLAGGAVNSNVFYLVEVRCIKPKMEATITFIDLKYYLLCVNIA